MSTISGGEKRSSKKQKMELKFLPRWLNSRWGAPPPMHCQLWLRNSGAVEDNTMTTAIDEDIHDSFNPPPSRGSVLPRMRGQRSKDYNMQNTSTPPPAKSYLTFTASTPTPPVTSPTCQCKTAPLILSPPHSTATKPSLAGDCSSSRQPVFSSP